VLPLPWCQGHDHDALVVGAFEIATEGPVNIVTVGLTSGTSFELGVGEVTELACGGQCYVFECDLDEAAFLRSGATVNGCQQTRCQVQSGGEVPRWDRVVDRGCFSWVARQERES